MCKVSVVVPVYNTEKYLRACLESLISQTMDDIEIIVVNDGSTDGSLAIAKEFAAVDKRFHVFSTENLGVSHARNYGAEMSKGNYLAFVDSDDKVEPDYCHAMYEKAVQDGNDLVICWGDRYKIWKGKIIQDAVQSTLVKEDNFRIADKPYILAKFASFIWNKLIKRELFFKALFSENMTFAEDTLLAVKLFALAQRIGTVKCFLYHYYACHLGVTSKFGWERLNWVTCMDQMTRFMWDYKLAKHCMRNLNLSVFHTVLKLKTGSL